MSFKPLFITAILSVMLGMVSCSTSRRGVAVAKQPESKTVTKDNGGRDKARDRHTPPGAMHADTKRLLSEAESWLGTPYKFGGNDREGVDCSGLVVQVYEKALDIKVPRTSRAQRDYCASLSKSDLIPGDLIFFATGKEEGRVTHVGIFVGEGRMIHASTAKGMVVVSEISTPYFNSHYVGSGCVEDYRAMLDIPVRDTNERATAPKPAPAETAAPAPVQAKAPTPAKTPAPAQTSVPPKTSAPAITHVPVKETAKAGGMKPVSTNIPAASSDEPTTEDARAAVLGSINETPLK